MSDFEALSVGVKRVPVRVDDGYIFLGAGGEVVRGKVAGVYHSDNGNGSVVIHYETRAGFICLLTPASSLALWDSSGGSVWCSVSQWHQLREYRLKDDDN